TFWTPQPSTRNSWLINKLLKIRPIYDCIKLRVGGGGGGNCITCRFWTENWSTFSSLKHYLHNDSNFSLGIQEDATLSILYSCNQILPHARLDEHLQLHAYLTTIQLSKGKTNTRYSTGQVYGILSAKGLEVTWNYIVWITGGIPKPKHFILASEN
ncbi:hypothetical protein IGI04_034452, partial [Brassica rapa subsp. trilocularis]